MENILDDVCDVKDLRKFEAQYKHQLVDGRVDRNTQFEYAWCLVRTTDSKNLQTGANLLEDLYRKASDDQAKRDYLYYMVIAYAKLKNYDKAIKYCDGILKVQPHNQQTQQLKKEINKRMQKDGLIGMAMAGGAAAIGIAGIATLIGLAVAGSRKH